MKIEDITDQMEKTMSLSSQPQQQPGEATTDGGASSSGPDIPPAQAITKGKTVDEVFRELNKSPLFMTDMTDMEDSDDIKALQALAYEGTPLENAADFKERGNEVFKMKLYGDAKEFYTKGVAILFGEERKRRSGGGEVTVNDDEGVPDSDDEIRKQRETLEALYVNRAACHLALNNYRSCWTDCAAALRLNPKNVKACFRSARALLAVERIEEADDVCARGLALEPENAPLKAVAQDIAKRAAIRDAYRKKEALREATEKRRAYLVKAALKARNIPARATAQPPEMEGTKLELVPDPDDPRSSLSFPTVLLYPLHLESDFIKGFNEMQTLEDHLGYIFPLPWDVQRKYTLDGVECYVETREGGLLKMGKRVTLLKVLGTGKVEVVDEVVRIYVVPKDGAEEWVKKHKAQRALERGEATS